MEEALKYNQSTDTLTADRFNVYTDLDLGEADVEKLDFSKIDPVAYANSANIEVSADSIDATTKMSGNWKNTRVSQLGWSATVDALISSNSEHTSIEQMVEAFHNREAVGLAFGIVGKTDVEFATAAKNGYKMAPDASVLARGKAYITSLSINTGAAGEMATYSVTFTGDGPLYIGTTATPSTTQTTSGE